MTSTEITPTTEVSFPKQLNGYDRDEVDRYVKNLSEAYQTAYAEYKAACAKYNGLLEEYKSLDGGQEQKQSNTAVITKLLADAETLARKTIADAQTQADKIRDDANAEAFGVKEQVQDLIRNAKMEAAQIEARVKKNLEQANEKMLRMINEMQDLLTSYALDETEDKLDLSYLVNHDAAKSGN